MIFLKCQLSAQCQRSNLLGAGNFSPLCANYECHWLAREGSRPTLCWRPDRCDEWSCVISERKDKLRGNGGIPQGAICDADYQGGREEVDFFCGLILPGCNQWANMHSAFQDHKSNASANMYYYHCALKSALERNNGIYTLRFPATSVKGRKVGRWLRSATAFFALSSAAQYSLMISSCLLVVCWRSDSSFHLIVSRLILEGRKKS